MTQTLTQLHKNTQAQLDRCIAILKININQEAMQLSTKDKHVNNSYYDELYNSNENDSLVGIVDGRFEFIIYQLSNLNTCDKKYGFYKYLKFYLNSVKTALKFEYTNKQNDRCISIIDKVNQIASFL